MEDVTFSPMYWLRKLAEPANWVCHTCAIEVKKDQYCPICGSNRTISLAEVDAQEIVKLIDELRAELASAREEIARTNAAIQRLIKNAKEERDQENFRTHNRAYWNGAYNELCNIEVEKMVDQLVDEQEG